MKRRNSRRTEIAGWLDAMRSGLPRLRLHPAVLAFAEARPAGEPWAVALSGGADSVALLLAVRAHWPERRLVALHFNHRLRGRKSDADERFCRKLCAKAGVALRRGCWNRQRPAPVSEEQARKARQEFFESELKRARASVLWTGHQMDDVAETMLMRMGRGSGTGGLAAPRPVQPMRGWTNLRPLLTLKREELRRLLGEVGCEWREDETNETDVFLRNRVRRGVLAAWREADPKRDVLAGAALARERLEEDDAALEAWLAAVKPLTPGGRLRLGKLCGCPRAVWRRAVHRWLLAQPHGSDLSRQGFEQLLAVAESGKPTRFSLGAKGFAVVRAGFLEYRRAGSSARSGR